MSYVKASVPKPSGKAPGVGIKASADITFFEKDDILTMPQADDKGVVITENIVMKPNKYGITIYGTQDTIEFDSKSEGDTDNEGIIPSFKFKHPGNKQAIREFKANWVGKQVVAVIKYCDGSGKDLFGTICNPMKIGVTMTANKDATSNEFTVTQLTKGDDIFIYEGTLPLEAPVAVIDAAATELDLVGEGQYQLTGHSAAVTIATVTGASHGLVFTLLGANSGTAPNVAASSTFILKDGTTWTGSAGAEITFKAFKSGSSAYVFFELSRS